NVVLACAVEECRHVVNLNHSHVDVLSGVYVQTATESHCECRVSSRPIRQPVVKVNAHVGHARHRFHERSHGFTAEVVARPDHQIVPLRSRSKCTTRLQIQITVI